MSEEFYQFKIDQLNGKEITMSDFKGKAVLIVNTASKCGYTLPIQGIRKTLQGLQRQWSSSNRFSL